MTESVARTLRWAPRILGMLLAAFISMFAFDVFDESTGVWQTLLALAMHLIPTAIVVLVIVLAWRREWVGAAAFLALAILYAVWARQHPSWILLIGGPLLVAGALYLAAWLARRSLAAARP